MQKRMVFIMCTVILFLICGSSAIISQNDLAFWTLLKEYHEMELPAQAAAVGNDSGASPPVAVLVAGAGQGDGDEGAREDAQPAPDDVVVRLLVQLTSEPVQLRVRCARGCRRVHRPCDLHLAPGSPLRMVCYAMLPECMHYGHTTINCGVYYTKRWPEVIQATCTLDYHTSESICASFARAGAQAEAEKPFRLMLESLGVRLWPANANANANASAGAGLAEGSAPGKPDERAAWLLAGGGLLAVLLLAYLVLHFDLACWTPCPWTWFNQYEVVEAKRNVIDSGPVSVVGNIPFHSSDPGRIFNITTGDSTDAETTSISTNYKLVMVIVNGVNNVRFSVPVPSRAFFYPGSMRLTEVSQSSSYASAPPYSCSYSPVFSTGISEKSEALLPSQPMHLTYREHPTSTSCNALQFYQDTSYAQDSSHKCASFKNAVLSFTKNPLQETSLQLENQNRVIISHRSTSTENSLVSLSHSTESVPDVTCVPSSNAFQLTTSEDSFQVVLSSHYTSLPKSTAMPNQEAVSTLLTSPCPTIESHHSSTPSHESPSNAVHHQQVETPVSAHTLPLAYPAAWVCPVAIPHPMSSLYSGNPVCSPNSSQLETANGEITAPVLTDGYVQPPSYTTEYPTNIAFPNSQADFSHSQSPDTVVFPTVQSYAATEAFPVAPGCLPPTAYSTVTLAYPSLPAYSQSAMNPRIGISHSGINYQCTQGITGSANQVPSPAVYSNSSACPENLGYQVSDFRGNTETSLPICSNTEVGQMTPDCPENRSYIASLVPHPCECSAASYNAQGIPTYSVPMNPAQCYPTSTTYLVSECQSSPCVEDYTQNPVCQAASTQAFNNQHMPINRPVMPYHSVNQRTYINQQPLLNHRPLPQQRQSATQRFSNHSFGFQRLADQQRSLANYRPAACHRPIVNVRPTYKQRPSQRVPTDQQTALYRPTPVHMPPASIQTAETCVPVAASTSQHPATFRASYGSVYQPAAPLNMGNMYHPASSYQPPAAYQAITANQHLTANQSETAFPQRVECQEASPYQQVSVFHNDRLPPETPYQTEPVNQPVTSYETYILETPQQLPPGYQVSTFPPISNYHQSDAFQPAPVYQQAYHYQIPTFRQGSVSSSPAYQVVSGNQPVPIQPQGLPSEMTCGFLQPPNCHTTPYPSASYAPTITTCNQNASSHMIADDNTNTLRPQASEHQPSIVHHPLMGYCTNSACLEMCSYRDTSGDAPRPLSEMPDQRESYSENLRDCSISIGSQEMCLNPNICGQSLNGDHRVIQTYQIRPDYPGISSFPLRAPYATNAESMESASMATPGHPTVYCTSVDWENNTYEATTMRPPISAAQLPWAGNTMPAPHNTQIYEIVNEETYRNGVENSNGTELEEKTPAYNPNNPCYDCNSNLQTPTYNESNENSEFYHPGHEHCAGSVVENESIPQRNLIMGADGCVYQEQPLFFNGEQSQGNVARREIGDGDSRKVQPYDRMQYQAQGAPRQVPRYDVHPDSRYTACHTAENSYECENETTATQYCCECNRRRISNPGRIYMNGYINTFQSGGNYRMREISNDISENISQLSLNDSPYVPS